MLSKDEQSPKLRCDVPHEPRVLGKGLDIPLVARVEKYGPVLKIFHQDFIEQAFNRYFVKNPAQAPTPGLRIRITLMRIQVVIVMRVRIRHFPFDADPDPATHPK